MVLYPKDQPGRLAKVALPQRVEPSTVTERRDYLDKIKWPDADRRGLFCGIGSDHDMPPVVCIAEEEEPLTPPDVVFDTDSVTTFLCSLAATRQGIRWQPAQRPVSDLQSSLYLEPLPVEYTDHRSGCVRKAHMPVHKIKHYTFGRMVGVEDASIYVLFPGLSHPRYLTARLSDGDFALWMDQVFFPALHTCYAEHYLQHYPSSSAYALMNAWATWKEARSIITQARQQQLNYFFPLEGLVALWSAHFRHCEKPPDCFMFWHIVEKAHGVQIAGSSSLHYFWYSSINELQISALGRQYDELGLP